MFKADDVPRLGIALNLEHVSKQRAVVDCSAKLIQPSLFGCPRQSKAYRAMLGAWRTIPARLTNCPPGRKQKRRSGEVPTGFNQRIAKGVLHAIPTAYSSQGGKLLYDERYCGREDSYIGSNGQIGRVAV